MSTFQPLNSSSISISLSLFYEKCKFYKNSSQEEIKIRERELKKKEHQKHKVAYK